MSKPDLDDGWLKYAHELDAALAVADFTKGARIVLREVFAQIFGPAKAKSAVVSPAAIGKALGLRREAIARGLKELLDSNALDRLEDGTYRFLKDYEAWTNSSAKGGPRLTPEEAAYCRFAPATAMAYKVQHASKSEASERINPVTENPSDRNQIDTETVTKSARADDPTVTKLIRDRINPVTQNVTKSARASEAPPDPPYRNAPVRGDIKTEDSLSLSARVGFAVSRNGEEPEEPFIANGQPVSPGFMPPSLTPDEQAELKRAIAFAQERFDMLEIGKGISGQPKPIDGMEVSWWLPALEALASYADQSKHEWKYLVGILKGFRKKGGPPAEARQNLNTGLVGAASSCEVTTQRKPTNAELGARIKVHMQELAERSGGHRAKRS